MAVAMDPQMPTGTEVASYQTYAQARAAVDFLSDSGLWLVYNSELPTIA